MSARIVFDLDGTLIDSAPDIHGIANALLDAEGLERLTLEDARGFVGHGAAVFVQRMRVARGLPESAQARLMAGFLERYDSAVTLTTPYPGVETALAALKARGHVLGICTNKPLRPARAVLAHLGLSGMFDAVFGGDSLPVRKPDPAPLHATFDALGSGARVYVGDSAVDAATAQAAQVPFLLYTEGYRSEPLDTLPHHAAFSDFADLPALVAACLAET